MFSVLLPLTNSFGKMENLNFSPDQLKGILSLFASGKLQRVFEEASSSMGLHSNVLLTSNGIARNNPKEDVEDQVSEDKTGMANFSGESSPELGERESDGEQIFLESKETAQKYTARELLEKANKGTKATSAQQTFRVSKLFP